MVPNTLGVIGLGGVGGAVAAQAARAGVPHVLGFDASTKDGVAAVRAGAITELAHDAASVIRRSDFVVLGGTARASVKLLESHADLLAAGDAVCTDLAGLKRPITGAATRLGLRHRFAGSHVVVEAAGDSRFGRISADRLNGALVYVTQLEGGDEAASEVGDFWTRVIGAHPVGIPAERHDEVVAWTDNLPTAAAAAVGLAIARRGPTGVTYGSGVLDGTRTALADPEASTRALLNNRDNVLAVLAALQAATDDLRAALEAGDVRAVRSWLGDAHAWRARYDR